MSEAQAELEVVKTETVHFRIDPEWLVDLLRKLWLERNFGKAIRIIDAGFPQLTIEDKFAVLTGKKKFIYSDSPDAEDRSEYVLVGDDWKPSGAYTGMKVANYLDVIDQCQIYRDNEEAFNLLKEISVLAWSSKGIPITKGPGKGGKSHGSPAGYISASYVTELICRLFPPPTTEQWEAFWGKHTDEVRDISEPNYWREQESSWNKKTELADKIMAPVEAVMQDDDEALAAQWCKENANNIEIFMAHDRVLWKRPCPLVDSKLESLEGWLLPNGKFYPCKYMEHIWLAEKLGKSEGDAEKTGWIKIANMLVGGTYITEPPNHKIPQKQLNTLFDWCQKHGKEMPKWAQPKKDK